MSKPLFVTHFWIIIRREVSFFEGDKFAKDHGLLFLETSAKTGSYVDDVALPFLFLTNLISKGVYANDQDCL